MKLSEKIQEALREQQEINLSDPAVQKRLAAQWGYVPAGAQPAPSIPEGWKLVPIEPTETMISEGSYASSLHGPHYISEGCAQQCWKYMLAASPEADNSRHCAVTQEKL